MGEENQSGSEGQGARVRRTLGGAHTSAAEGGASKGVCDVRTARDSARFNIKSRAQESAKRRRPSLRGAAKRPHSERSERFKIKSERVCEVRTVNGGKATAWTLPSPARQARFPSPWTGRGIWERERGARQGARVRL